MRVRNQNRSLKTEIDLITKKELSTKLSISSSFIDKLMQKEGLPHIKLGKSVRFKIDEVAAFLERRKRP